MSQATSPEKKGKNGAVIALVVVVILLLIAAGTGWALYFTKTAKTSPSADAQEITALAFQHWNAIGIENITLVMSQYAPNATLVWVMNYTKYDEAYNAGLNGQYSNLTLIKGVWARYFTDSVVYYWVGGYKVSVSGNVGIASGYLWYVMANGTVNQSASVNTQLFTAIIPYKLVYYNFGGGGSTSTVGYSAGSSSDPSGWQLVLDEWGLPSNPGHVYPGAYGLKSFYS